MMEIRMQTVQTKAINIKRNDKNKISVLIDSPQKQSSLKLMMHSCMAIVGTG